MTCDFQDFVEMNTDPLAIVVVTSGTRGDRLLFRYPSTEPTNHGVFEKCMYYSVVIYWALLVITRCVFFVIFILTLSADY